MYEDLFATQIRSGPLEIILNPGQDDTVINSERRNYRKRGYLE